MPELPVWDKNRKHMQKTDFWCYGEHTEVGFNPEPPNLPSFSLRSGFSEVVVVGTLEQIHAIGVFLIASVNDERRARAKQVAGLVAEDNIMAANSAQSE